MRLTDEPDCSSLPQRLNSVLPEGIRVLAVEMVDEAAPRYRPRFVRQITRSHCREGFDAGDLERRAESLLAAPSLPRERRSRIYDLRPLIEDLQVHLPPARAGVRIQMRLRSEEGATGRPDEVLDALGVPREEARIERTGLHLRIPPEASNLADGAA